MIEKNEFFGGIYQTKFSIFSYKIPNSNLISQKTIWQGLIKRWLESANTIFVSSAEVLN